MYLRFTKGIHICMPKHFQKKKKKNKEKTKPYGLSFVALQFFLVGCSGRPY